MTGGHISDDLLRVFVDGDIGNELGIQIALHLDDCARCHARARELDPLTAHFASCDDPPVPDELFQAISASRQQHPTDVVVPAVGLLALAEVLAFMVNGNPTMSELLMLLYAGSNALVAWFVSTDQIAFLFFSLCFFTGAVAVSHIRQTRSLSTW